MGANVLVEFENVFLIGGWRHFLKLKLGAKNLFWDRENQLFWELYGPLETNGNNWKQMETTGNNWKQLETTGNNWKQMETTVNNWKQMDTTGNNWKQMETTGNPLFTLCSSNSADTIVPASVFKLQ